MSAVRDLRKRFQGYSGARPDVVSLFPANVSRVLDVGCGAGMTGALIKARWPHAILYGLEPDVSMARLAACNYDVMLQLPVDAKETEHRLAECEPFDVIVCADVLEHLVQPHETLRMLAGLLTSGGTLITSIPNVRHVSTFIDLGMRGTWPARDRGIHDRTHLRFYARRDILALGHIAGLVMLREKRNLRLFESVPASMVPAKLLDFWPFRAFLTFQYLHAWTHGHPATASATR